MAGRPGDGGHMGNPGLPENACIDELERTERGYRILCLNDAPTSATPARTC